ncbi:MAG: MATE family efflux transporter [Bacteroidales bacterium]|nr:MATE family efflux transporter [Bacteroidales bacterium]
MNKRILKLAIPNIISNITIPLLGMVDTALMGHLDSLIYVGAIALGSMIFNFIYWGMGFLRMGTVGFTGQAMGRKDKKEIFLVLARALSIAVFISIILVILHSFIIDWSLLLTNSSLDIESEAKAYFQVRIWALPATLIILTLSGWFIGMQNTIYPMIISIFSNIINITLSFFFIYYMGMKTEGVALGTVIAQYLALILAAFLFMKKYRNYIIPINLASIINSKLKEFMNVNKDIFIRTLGIIFVMSYFTIQSANISDTTLAVNTILLQFFILFSYMLDGFANSAEALSSEAIGARNLSLLKRVIKNNMVFAFIFSIIFTLIYALGGEYILMLLTNNTQILEAATPQLYWVIAVPIISFTAFIMDGVYIGATASKAMRNTLVISSLFVFFPIAFWGFGDMNIRLWSALLAFLFARGILLLLRLKKDVYPKAVSG